MASSTDTEVVSPPIRETMDTAEVEVLHRWSVASIAPDTTCCHSCKCTLANTVPSYKVDAVTNPRRACWKSSLFLEKCTMSSNRMLWLKIEASSALICRWCLSNPAELLAPRKGTSRDRGFFSQDETGSDTEHLCGNLTGGCDRILARPHLRKVCEHIRSHH